MKVRNTTASKATKLTIIFSEISKSEQAKFTSKRDSKTNKSNWTEKKNAKHKSGKLLGAIARLGTKAMTSIGLRKKG